MKFRFFFSTSSLLRRIIVVIIYVLDFTIFLHFCSCSTIKTYAPSSSFAFVAGASHGTAQVLQHRNDRFFAVFPNASKRFFGPESWRNKYFGFDPAKGRNRVPIWFTDGYHLANTVTQSSAFCSGASLSLSCFNGGKSRASRKRFIIGLGVSFAAYTAGNYFAYDVLFR